MTMPSRSSTAERLGRRIRSRHGQSRRALNEEQPLAERRDRDPSQDSAVYTCQCGMVFEAPVNTSVDCPHCGGQQAW
jgi:rubrerythrin